MRKKTVVALKFLLGASGLSLWMEFGWSRTVNLTGEEVIQQRETLPQTYSTAAADSSNAASQKHLPNVSHSLWWTMDDDAATRRKSFEKLPLWMRDYLHWHAKAHAELLRQHEEDSHAQQEGQNASVVRQQQQQQPQNQNDPNGKNEHLQSNNNNTNNNSHTQQEQEKRPQQEKNNYQFLILRCFATDVTCGGTADRLYSLPLYVLLAARLRRILYIYWERPCDLSHYLEPATELPRGSFDWRMPDWLIRERMLFLQESFHTTNDWTHINKGSLFEKFLSGDKTPDDLPRILTLTFQAHHMGAHIYDYHEPLLFGPASTIGNNSSDSNNNTPVNGTFRTFSPHTATTSGPRPPPETHRSFNQVYAPLWKTFFRPVPTIRQKIQETWTALQLEPDHYVATHIRARYRAVSGAKTTGLVARNAMDCTSEWLQDGEPIFVSSDFANSTWEAAAYVTQEHPEQRLVHRPLGNHDDDHVMHLDRGTAFVAKRSSQWTEFEASNRKTDISSATSGTLTARQDNAGICHNYDDTFVDLYLLVGARCRIIHVRNFARWAQLIHGANDDGSSCMQSHKKQQCMWKSIQEH